LRLLRHEANTECVIRSIADEKIKKEVGGKIYRRLLLFLDNFFQD